MFYYLLEAEDLGEENKDKSDKRKDTRMIIFAAVVAKIKEYP